VKHLRTVCVAAASILVAGAAFAQPSGPSGEGSGLQHAPPSSGPLVLNWKLKKVDGAVDLLVNPDGSYVFSGQVSDKKPGKDFDIAVALKSTTGAVILFHYVGDMSHGVQWSKQGESVILKDDFATFAKHHDYAWRYTLPESDAAKKKAYEERERKREKVRKEEADARRRHDAQMEAQKEAEERQLAQEEMANSDSQSALQAVSSTIGDVAGAILSIF
jgi:hypothetical protein